jgi:hypothetical protein
MSKQTAAKGISYLSGGEWKVAKAGDEVEMDDEQVKAAIASGAIKEAAAVKPSPPKTKGASA